jgi:peptidyl-prolyl cis-trans isomerase A (cyclophilin A)
MRYLLLLFLLSACADTAPASSDALDATPEPPEALMNPALLTETAPASFKVQARTTRGDFVIQVTRAWAPNGADRFYNLVKAGYYSDIAFFRVIAGFMAQFGIHGDPRVSAVWREARITDDPVAQSNTRGRLTFATSGPNSRTTQLFINLVDNARLDTMGFAPFGEVVSGMEIVDALHAGYGEGAPRGLGPDQGRIQREGNAYLRAEFGQLDYLLGCDLLP